MMEKISVSQTKAHWHAVHVKARHEKIVAQVLEEKNIEVFLPMRAIQRKWSDRTKIVDFPLFPNYLFVFIELISKKIVLQTRGVVRIIGNPLPIEIPVEDIESIKAFIRNKVEIDPYPHFVSGKAMEVTQGPFKGIRGILDRKKGKYRLVIRMDIIHMSAGIEIDIADVRMLD